MASGYLDEGKISVFNNGGDGIRAFSSVHLIDPELSGYTYEKENTKFKPSNFSWSWNGAILGRTMYETKKSGAHSLPNGNFIICETSLGQVSEITKTGKHLWTYKNPSGSNLFSQFDNISSNANSIFRAEKYPIDYIGFTGKDLMPKGLIENENALSSSCATLSILTSKIDNLKILNPVYNNMLKFNHEIEMDDIRIVDVNGRVVFATKNFLNDHVFIAVESGFYFIELQKEHIVRRVKIIIN